MATQLSPAQKEQAKTSISHFLPGRGLTTYFLSCYLRVQFPISLHLGAECDLPHWYTDGFWHILDFCEPLRTKKEGNKNLRDNQALTLG